MYHLYLYPVANFRSNGRLFFTPLLKTPSTRVKSPFNKTNTTLNRQCKTFVVQRDTKTNKQNDNKVSKDGFVWCCCCCNVLGPPCGGFPRIRFARATTVCKSFFWCFSLSLFSILVFGFYYRLHTHKCRNKSKRIWKFGLPDCNVNSWH